MRDFFAWFCIGIGVAGLIGYPFFHRWGERRLEALELELQALEGQIKSELRAESYYAE